MQKSVKVFFVDGSYKSVAADPSECTVEKLWEIVASKLELKSEVSQWFFIWGQDENLELLLFSDTTLSQAITEWPTFVKKYGKLKKPKKSEFRFLFKSTSVLPLSAERSIKDPEAVRLFYMQAVHNVVSGNYPCTPEVAIQLAGLQLQITVGDHRPEAHVPGYLLSEVSSYIPGYLLPKKRPAEWEHAILEEHKKHIKKEAYISQLLYLQLTRQWSYYGSTFYRGQFKPEGSVFLHQEYEGDIVIGVNVNGLHIIDPNIHKIETWHFENLTEWGHSDKTFFFRSGDDAYTYKTSQGELISDLLFEWKEEKEKQESEIKQIRQKQASQSDLLANTTSPTRPVWNSSVSVPAFDSNAMQQARLSAAHRAPSSTAITTSASPSSKPASESSFGGRT